MHAILATGSLVQWVECSPMVRETGVQVESYLRLKKWYLIPPCFNTEHYNVPIKGKVEQPRERSSALPYTTIYVVATEKGAFG